MTYHPTIDDLILIIPKYIHSSIFHRSRKRKIKKFREIIFVNLKKTKMKTNTSILIKKNKL